jgi:hypothetical protein
MPETPDRLDPEEHRRAARYVTLTPQEIAPVDIIPPPYP